MTVTELTTEIQNTVQDDSFSSQILSLLNRCVNELAEELILPDLFVSATVATGTAAYTALPANYHKLLRKCYSSANGAAVEIVPHLDLIETNPALDTTGTVSQVSVYGTNLYYQGIPDTADTLTLWYYRIPTAMTAGTGVPDGIPCFFHPAILVPYVCGKIFEQIEDGIEGGKVNTAFFRGEFERAKSKFISRNTFLDTLKPRGFSA